MYKLKILKEAKRDLKNIENYIIDEYDNPAAANRLTSAFRKSFKRVREQPFSCPCFPLQARLRKQIIKEH